MHLEELTQFDPGRFDLHVSLIDKLADLYADMDRQYQAVADHYGFNCTGCEDNCCYTRFFHHTYIEYGYLRKGFRNLDPLVRSDLKHRAFKYCRQRQRQDVKPQKRRPICPLNENNRCILYAFRPMICRLHGLPHEIRKPGSPVAIGPGCHIFEKQFGAGDYTPFDRTPLYQQMASLEMELRQALRLTAKIKMAVADMLCTF